MPMKDPMPAKDFEPVKVTGVAKKYVAPKKVIAVDPEGNEVILAAQNARDWASRPGHSIKGPYVPTKAAVVEAAEAEAEDVGEPVKTEADEAKVKAMAELEALREEAASLGIDVDARWGKRRLTEKIEEAKLLLT